MEQLGKLGRAMEAETISKNEASQKSHARSKGNMLKLFFVIVISALFFSCAKDDNKNPDPPEISEDMLDEPMPDDLLEFFESCPITNYYDVKDFGFSGTTLRASTESATLDNLFEAMLAKAFILTNRENFQIPAEKGDEKNKPAQNGLAYVWGSKLYKERSRFGKNKCQQLLQGLDCSGFVYHLLDSAEIHYLPIPKNDGLSGPSAQALIKFVKGFNNTNLNNKYYNGRIRVKELDLKSVTSNDLKNGDIIYRINLEKNKTSHIGMIFKTTDGKVIMFQSAGGDIACETNTNIDHGPIQRYLANDKIRTYFTTSSTADGEKLTGEAHAIRISTLGAFDVSISKETDNSALASINVETSDLELQTSEIIRLIGVCYSNTNQDPTVDASGVLEVHKDYNNTTNAPNYNFDLDLKSLLPEKEYSVKGYVKTSTNRYIYSDEILKFTTEKKGFLILSPDKLDFTKDKGSNLFTINTSLKITNITSNQSWCKISYNKDNPQVVYVDVDENKTDSSRPATITVEANNSANEKTTGTVAVNQEGTTNALVGEWIWDDEQYDLPVTISNDGKVTLQGYDKLAAIGTKTDLEGTWSLTNDKVTFSFKLGSQNLPTLEGTLNSTKDKITVTAWWGGVVEIILKDKYKQTGFFANTPFYKTQWTVNKSENGNYTSEYDWWFDIYGGRWEHSKYSDDKSENTTITVKFGKNDIYFFGQAYFSAMITYGEIINGKIVDKYGETLYSLNNNSLKITYNGKGHYGFDYGVEDSNIDIVINSNSTISGNGKFLYTETPPDTKDIKNSKDVYTQSSTYSGTKIDY